MLGIYVVASWGVLTANFPLVAQTIQGRLSETGSDQPIDLGFIAMLTESGDSVAVTITNENGFFSVTSAEPGSFLLHASALGYRESVDGVFDLGADGVMQIEFRLRRRAVTLEGLVVYAERVAKEPRLISNGFYNRARLGFGKFITPGDIAESLVFSTREAWRWRPLADKLPKISRVIPKNIPNAKRLLWKTHRSRCVTEEAPPGFEPGISESRHSLSPFGCLGERSKCGEP